MYQNEYLPEGWSSGTQGIGYTPAQLEEAGRTGQILEGWAVLCDQGHNLLVDLGCAQGIIPREETALGIAEGTTREIAVLSRVGKPVCFKVAGRSDGLYQLSRRSAQEEAVRAYLSHLRPGDVIPARVTHLEPFGVFADVACGLVSFIGIENLSVSRIPHPAERVRSGQNLYGVVKEATPHRITLSHRELLGTWEQNSAHLTPGMTVSGIVRGIEEYGVFVELTPNLSGLAERREGVTVGCGVTVYIKALLPERMKIKLVILECQEEPRKKLLTPRDYYIREGHLERWQYSPDCCIEKQVFTVFA